MSAELSRGDSPPAPAALLAVRTLSGISGDMMLTGLAMLSGLTQEGIEQRIAQIGVDALKGCLRFEQVSVAGVAGFKALISLKPEHTHRSFEDIRMIITHSAMTSLAQKIAVKAFALLAEAEARIHQVDVQRVVFHEIGGLDGILDICLSAILYEEGGYLGTASSPLPICDGVIECAHGRLSSPAPAALELLKDVPVYGVDSKGETVTPTGIAILKALDARFEKWPAGTLLKSVFVYGGRILPGIPNGVTFARVGGSEFV